MPGVADAEKRNREIQELESRKREREELIRLVKEDRLEEADEKQLEHIKLALELKEALAPKEPTKAEVDTEAITEAMKQAVSEVVKQLPERQVSVGYDTSSDSPEREGRPSMKHTSLGGIKVKDSDVEISHGKSLAKEEEGKEDAKSKRERLKKLREGKE